MTTTVERTYEVDAPIEDLWDLISDARLRAEAISVVETYSVEGEETVWELAMPIRAIPGTVSVRTRDVERDPPRYVRFVGRSRIMDVEGEHELTETDEGCQIRNRFVVKGRFPGVETFFERNVDDEIENLVTTVAAQVGASTDE